MSFRRSHKFSQFYCSDARCPSLSLSIFHGNLQFYHCLLSLRLCGAQIYYDSIWFCPVFNFVCDFGHRMLRVTNTLARALLYSMCKCHMRLLLATTNTATATAIVVTYLIRKTKCLPSYRTYTLSLSPLCIYTAYTLAQRQMEIVYCSRERRLRFHFVRCVYNVNAAPRIDVCCNRRLTLTYTNAEYEHHTEESEDSPDEKYYRNISFFFLFFLAFLYYFFLRWISSYLGECDQFN